MIFYNNILIPTPKVRVLERSHLFTLLLEEVGTILTNMYLTGMIVAFVSPRFCRIGRNSVVHWVRIHARIAPRQIPVLKTISQLTNALSVGTQISLELPPMHFLPNIQPKVQAWNGVRRSTPFHPCAARDSARSTISLLYI